MCHTIIWDVQYGKIRVKHDTAYYTNTLYDTSLVFTWQVTPYTKTYVMKNEIIKYE